MFSIEEFFVDSKNGTLQKKFPQSLKHSEKKQLEIFVTRDDDFVTKKFKITKKLCKSLQEKNVLDFSYLDDKVKKIL